MHFPRARIATRSQICWTSPSRWLDRNTVRPSSASDRSSCRTSLIPAGSTPGFARALDRLLEQGERSVVAVMCAEAVPWRCHRSLLADALTARGVRVEHIMDARTRRPHELTKGAVVEGAAVDYPGGREQPTLPLS